MDCLQGTRLRAGAGAQPPFRLALVRVATSPQSMKLPKLDAQFWLVR